MDRNNRRKKDSSFQAVLMMIIAVAVVLCAIFVIVMVFQKIRGDYKELEEEIRETSQEESTAIETEASSGWVETEDGFVYLLEDGSRVKDTWQEIDGFLYYFDEEGIMAQGEWSMDGQIFTCSQKGYLKDIQFDFSYVPDSMGETVDSLVKVNSYWCYLGESDGPFKPILYRKATEDEVMNLGGEENPEYSTRYSLRSYGDYLYYLPKVQNSSGLTESQKELCDTLFRAVPGTDSKEMIAEDVGGYLVLDGVIYYSQDGEIKKTESGTMMALGEGEMQVTIKNGSCYLTDAYGQAVQPESQGTIEIGDRIYRVEDDGKIRYVKHGNETIDGYTYSLTSAGQYDGIVRKNTQGSQVVARETYGIQSYCIVNQHIYYSAYVKRDSSGIWYSQMYRTDLDGGNKQIFGNPFCGMIGNLYYYEDTGEIYGEYYPRIWESAYGSVVAITLDGTIYKIEDSSQRKGRSTTGNDMLELIAVQDDQVICLWHDVSWTRSSGVTSTLWDQAVSLSRTARSRVASADLQETEETLPEETTQADSKTSVIIKPIETTEAQTAPAQTVSPNADKPTSGTQQSSAQSPTARNPGTIAPSPDSEKPGQTVQTQAPSEAVRIIPIG